MENQAQNQTVMHPLKDNKSTISPLVIIVLFVVIILIGIGSGYALGKYGGHSVVASLLPNTSGSSVVSGKIYGSSDIATFKDTAVGVIQNGGKNGEGQYHLVRPGGPSQYVYMTSSVLDLSQFVGKNVKVWGQTQASQEVGWLMDVGRVQVM